MLVKEVEEKRRQIQTDAYPMSIGEIANLYTEEELDIHPEFQRIHRWDDEQKSKLIESLLLGIPLPSIFVSQRPDGVWDVIDGVQRLSTIFSFMGIYKNEENELEQPFTLISTKLLPSLQGKEWDSDGENAIDIELKRQFKREKLDIKIIKKESDPVAKYDLFQRLNTLGTKLSDQEVRNCLLIMLNKSFYEMVKELAQDENFKNTIPLTDRQVKEKYDYELALRFIVYRWFLNNRDYSIGDVGEFITEIMEKLATDKAFNMQEQKSFFNHIFTVINVYFGEDAFRKRKENGSTIGAFSLSYYEAILLKAIRLATTKSDLEELKTFVSSLATNQTFLNNSGSGVRASSRLRNFCGL